MSYSFKYQDKLLFTYEFAVGIGVGQHRIVVNKQASIGLLRRFVSSELMRGPDYISGASRELAAVLFAAVATPALQFVQYGSSRWSSLASDLIKDSFRLSTDRQGDTSVTGTTD